MSKGRGYLLPEGAAYTDDVACAIVFVPNKVEYFNALRGTLDYLGTWLAWERDEDKRGKDAALAWLEANELTQECWAMATCDQILSLLISIDSKIGNIGGCCDSTTVGDVVTVTTTIIPGVGPDPTVWGETSVSDWDEWLEYVCYHANKFVDRLVETADTLDTIMEIGAYTVEFFANIMRVLRFLSLVYPVSYDSAVQIYQSFKEAGDASDTFDGVAAKFESARSDIVCAFINGSSVSAAVETALDDNTLWTILYSFNNYDSLQAMVYEGTVDGSVYLAPVKRDDCECGGIGEFQYTEEVDSCPAPSYWLFTSPAGCDATVGNPAGCFRSYKSGGGAGGHIRASVGTIRAMVGLGVSSGKYVELHAMSFDLKRQAGATADVTIQINHDSGVHYEEITVTSETWENESFTFDPPLIGTEGTTGWMVQIYPHDGSGKWHYFDNLMLDFDANL